MVLEEISLNLIGVAEKILKDSEGYTQTDDSLEFIKNGRKYKLVNNDRFELIKESDKYLIVSKDYNDFKENYSLFSSYYILSKIDNVLQNYPELCLSIMGAAREIELNRWYDLDICVTLPEDASYTPSGIESEALRFASKITKQHINNGLLMMCSAKINFFHTDHTASKTIEGTCLRNLVTEMFGEEALVSDEVYNAIRCFSHWGSIKGILYKLELRNLLVDDELKMRFRNFPNPPDYLKQSLYERYPAGTSKFSLCKKALLKIADSAYGKILPLNVDIHWFFELCSDIETDPCKYHLRSSTKNLSRYPVNLASLRSTNEILEYCAAVMHGSNGIVGKKLLTASKFPKKKAIKNHPIYLETKKLNQLLNKYEQEGVEEWEIVKLIGDLGDKSAYAIINKEMQVHLQNGQN